MLVYKDKEYRNLQEQVWKNASDIQDFLIGKNVLDEFGIQVLGQITSIDKLPSTAAEYGDAYAVGLQSPYELYIWTRNNETGVDFWFNIGTFPLAGPQGPQGLTGETGPKGERGNSVLTYNEDAPGSVMTLEQITNAGWKSGDTYINALSGDVWVLGYNASLAGYTWVLKGNIRGPQGVQGQQGIQGPKGDTGPQGPVGPQGDPGDIIKIVDVLASTNLLPDPTIVSHTDAYLVGTAAPYHLYIIVGEDITTQQWFDTGAFGDFELVNISVPLTATQGTLTSDQLSILQSSPYNMINLNGEYFRLNDDRTDDGYLVYSHIGSIDAENEPISKIITITISTLGWVLTTDKLIDEEALNDAIANLPSATGDVEEILQFKMSTSNFYQYKSDKSLVKAVPDISTSIDTGSWQTFYNYIREDLMGMTSSTLDCGAKIGFFLSQSGSSSEVPTKFKSYITSSGVVPSSIDSFKIECIGASQSAAECIINMTVWTRDAREFELVMFNGASGVVASSWQEKASKAYVDGLIGDINTILDTINGEVL